MQVLPSDDEASGLLRGDSAENRGPHEAGQAEEEDAELLPQTAGRGVANPSRRSRICGPIFGFVVGAAATFGYLSTRTVQVPQVRFGGSPIQVPGS